jgi:NAD+ synthase
MLFMQHWGNRRSGCERSELPDTHWRVYISLKERYCHQRHRINRGKDSSMQTVKVIGHIVAWLNEYCDRAGMTGFTVGVSGGIDSAVTSTLCARTGKSVLVLNMPIYQASDQLSRSFEHVQWLEENFENVQGIDLDLTPTFKTLVQTLPDQIQDGLSMANTRSRLRMLTLYAFSTHHRMLVAGTGNKVEDFGVGFYTKYGDGGVDLSPMADLMKSEVYKIGRELAILDEILKAPPTDGLWEDGRTDESQIGATYDELEWAMTYDQDSGLKLSPRQADVLSIYQGYYRVNRHKMLPIPICKIPDGMK